jgi:hypothetical protein
MARTKQTARKPQTSPRRTPRDFARMTVGGGSRAIPPSPKKQMREDVDLSTEICFLETDIAEHQFPETQPRQAPAMTCYRGAPPQAQPEAPKEKRWHCRSQKKRKGPALTNPEVSPTPRSAPPRGQPHPEVPAPRGGLKSPPRTQPEVIDLTEED